ncbi:MAG: uncharacterized protein QOK05_54 [Chloroflexota bacterium]|nr:uncharacterized protein [Chloroflexota bacterium]
MTTDYAGLVEFIVKNIVEKPDAVEVDGNSRRHRSQTVEVRLDPGDVGRVIGKGGKNIEAIRAVVKAAAIKDHQRVNVEVITEDDLDADADADADADYVDVDAGEVEAPAMAQGGGDIAGESDPAAVAGYGETGIEPSPEPASGEPRVPAGGPEE